MKLFKTISLAVAVGFVATASAQYDFIVLHPTHSQGYGAGPGQQVGAVGDGISTGEHAYVWTGGAGPGTDLHPLGFDSSMAYATDGGTQVGSATDSSFVTHAMLWNGTNVAIDLQAALTIDGFIISKAFGVAGNEVVGQGLDGGFASKAILWTTALTYVDLTPAGYEGYAVGIGGGVQVGNVYLPLVGTPLAALWTGSAASYFSLHPLTAIASAANATDGSQTVGYVDFGSGSHAALWNGVAHVDIHPAGYDSSVANAVAGGWQAGTGTETLTGNQHALLWNGSNVATDLHSFAGGYVTSQAVGVDAAGNVSGTATDAFGTPYAVYWKLSAQFGLFQNPVNDPASPVESVFKKGRSIHLRIKLFDGNGGNLANQTVRLEVEAIGPVNLPINEEALAQGSTEGDLFVYDPVSQTYNYLMSTKTLQAGVRYQLTARLDNSAVAHSVTIGLR